MVMKNRPVDPGSIQGSHRPISFIRIKHRTRANDNLCKYLMYHAACKVEFQPFTRSYSQLTFFNFLLEKITAKQQGKPQAKTTAAGTVAARQQRLGAPTTPAGAAPSR